MITEEEFKKYLKEDAIGSLYHSLFETTGTAARQDLATGVNIAVPGDYGKKFYQNANEFHKQTSGDDVDDGAVRHELPKIIMDTTLSYPLSLGIAGAINLANVGSPDTQAKLRFLGNAGLGIGMGAAKANTAGKEYTLGDAAFDALTGVGTDVASYIYKMPHIGTYMGMGLPAKVMGIAGKAAAEDVLKKAVLDEILQDDEYASMYAYKGVKE